MANKAKKELTIEERIERAVGKAIEAGRRQAEQKPSDTYKATERRLYALPDLKEKVEKDSQYLEYISEHGLPGHSNDLIRFQKAGVRLEQEDIEEAVVQDLKAQIAANKFEIKIIEDALAPLTSDPYFRSVSGRYFDHLSDEEIGKEIPCDPRTVRRNRGRLVRRAAVRLYGVDAI